MTFKSCLSWLFFFNFLLSGWQLVLRDFFLHPFLFLFVGFKEKKGENAGPMFRLFVVNGRPPHRKLKKRTTRAILFTSCYVHVHSSISSVYARSLVERRRILYKDIIWASLRLFLSSRRSFSIVLYTERPHHRGGGMCVWETEAGNREGLPEHLMDE
jgi:hypothetical protein